MSRDRKYLKLLIIFGSHKTPILRLSYFLWGHDNFLENSRQILFSDLAPVYLLCPEIQESSKYES